jgi:hypothetical protein
VRQDVTTPNGSFKVLDEHSLPPDHPAMHLGPPKEDASLPLFAALTKLKEAREQEKHKKRSRSRSPKKGDDKRSKHVRALHACAMPVQPHCCGVVRLCTLPRLLSSVAASRTGSSRSNERPVRASALSRMRTCCRHTHSYHCA